MSWAFHRASQRLTTGEFREMEHVTLKGGSGKLAGMNSSRRHLRSQLLYFAQSIFSELPSSGEELCFSSLAESANGNIRAAGDNDGVRDLDAMLHQIMVCLRWGTHSSTAS